ncbi:MAG TPA: hypothetical protein VJ953_17945 [Saprospiraceae bacterium]|nr:hypothetical protein [Saprospiraceae bacterium]
MVTDKINVVSLDVPYPPDYGGAIDIFYKIKALHDSGVQVYFHCFEYGRPPQEEISKWCKEVHYYPRKTDLLSHFSTLPYIIYSRRSKALLDQLATNDYPILFEGFHTIYHLIKGKLPGRKVLIRSHNIEHNYYFQLARREKNLIKKAFYYKEAFQLKQVIGKLPKGVCIGAISIADTEYWQAKIGHLAFWLPPFHSNNRVVSEEGIGEYVLYHGNLSVSENSEMAEQLIQLFGDKDILLIITGKDPGDSLRKGAKQRGNIQLIADPDAVQMNELIKNAQVILLPTFQPTGVKLKLLESLYRGRFCLANSTMMIGTRLEAAMIIAEIEDFYAEAARLMKVPFSKAHIQERQKLLSRNYANATNAQLLINRASQIAPKN